MPITYLCDKSTPGAVEHDMHAEGYGESGTFYTLTIAHGCVVELRERNGYHDSDFEALYWDEDSKAFRWCEYASTRGWTYPAHAEIDATPEVRARWDAELERARQAAIARERAIPKKGRIVEILPNNGKAKGLAGRTGRIFWMQEQRSRFGTWSYGWRVGVDLGDERVFLNADRVRVVTEQATA